jgi:hypothetical protein
VDHLRHFIGSGRVGGHEDQDITNRPRQESEFPCRLTDMSSSALGGWKRSAGRAVGHDFDCQDGALLANIPNLGMFPKILRKLAKVLGQGSPPLLFRGIL